MRLAELTLFLGGLMLAASPAAAAPYQYTFATGGGSLFTLVGELENGTIELAGMKPGDAASTAEVLPVFYDTNQLGLGDVWFFFRLCKELGVVEDLIGFGWNMSVHPVSSDASGYSLDLDDDPPEVYASAAGSLPYFSGNGGTVLLTTFECVND